MEREQIIKALECCYSQGDCKDCPYMPNDESVCEARTLGIDSFALIKQLTEENARLFAENKWLKLDVGVAEAELTMAKQDRADTVRKMQEMLKERNKVYCDNEVNLKTMNFVVDLTAKEMLEDE